MGNKIKKRAREALEFLNDHPAIAPDSLLGKALWFSIQDVCKRGYDQIVSGMGVNIWASSKYAKKFKNEFKEKYKKLENDYKDFPKDKMLGLEKKLARISVPYKKLFGEPWKYDRTEYWAEMSFFIYRGKPKEWIKNRDLDMWQGYSTDINVSAPTFEEMVVKIAEKFKKQFGNFTHDDFLTKKEIQNHKKERSFFSVKMRKRPLYSLKRNPKYIEVGPVELNHRWARWFLKTPYGKKAWGNDKDLKKILS